MDITYCIIQDIKMYFDKWICWSPYEDSEDEVTVRKEKLSILIKEVECELKKEAKRYNKRFD